MEDRELARRVRELALAGKPLQEVAAELGVPWQRCVHVSGPLVRRWLAGGAMAKRSLGSRKQYSGGA